MKGSVLVPVLCVNICAVAQQQLHGVTVSHLNGTMQGPKTPLKPSFFYIKKTFIPVVPFVAGVHNASPINQQLGGKGISIKSRVVQSRPPRPVSYVRVWYHPQ